jgi:hypothetical protein
MNHQRITTANFYAPGRGYFSRQILPSLLATQKQVSPTLVTYCIAEKKIHIYLYGNGPTVVFPPAFAHQKSGKGTADLTIHAWDSIPTNQCPLPPWDDVDYQQPSETADTSFFGAYVGGEESLSFYDDTTGTGYFWMRDASELSDWSTGAPFRAILNWYFTTQNIHLVHGAVIGWNNQSILLTAKSGSGKSTTALTAIINGMDYIGDDYTAITLTDQGTIAHSLYQSAKITRSGLDFFPELVPAIWNKHFSGNQKAIVFLSDIFPDRVKTSLPLSAIFIPTITGGETKIIPVNKVQALIAIAPTTMLQLPLADTGKLKALKDIIDQVPCYVIELGDVKNVTTIIKNFLKETVL